MRYDDEYDDDLPARRRPRGVSGGWRVAAILCGGLAGLLALALLVATAALLERPRPAPPPPPQPAPLFAPKPQAPPIAGAPNDDDPDIGNPRALPYPLVQDLRPPGALPTVPGEPAPKAEPNPREQFLAAGGVLWANDEPSPPQAVLVSPDGKSIAYAGSQGAFVGPPGAPRLVPGTLPLAGPPRNPRAPAGAERTGSLVWSPLGTSLTWAGADGQVGLISIAEQRFQEIDGARARWAVAVPPKDEQLVLVRGMARPKVEAPLRANPTDPSEVVVFDRKKKAAHILIPLGTAVWRSPAVSPDGKRLALISDSGHEGELPSLWRVFLIDLAGGVPKPITPAVSLCRSLCWAPDGKTLVYDRSASANEENYSSDLYRANLFEMDPATGRESRLTVGGEFSSPSVTTAGELFCLAHSRQGGAERVELFHLPRDKARELAAKPVTPRHSAKAWTALAAAALQEAGLPADARESALDEEKVKKLAAAFAANYRKQFSGEPPDTAAGLDRLRGEARGLGLAPGERRRVALVLGAAEGEYLCRKHHARWALEKPAGPPLADPKVHELFRHIVNPFRDIWAEDDDYGEEEPVFGTLSAALTQAEGRPLVLAHDQAVRTHLAAADPDLARGLGLLKEGQGEEADRVLLELTKRHPGNYHLALHVGALLSEQGRTSALRTLVSQLDAEALKDARVYNLVGVSRLDDDPAKAIDAFRKALRCNLYHGAAYFNLALAYQKQGDTASARLCLRRYLKLLAYGSLADDARRRLAELPQGAGN